MADEERLPRFVGEPDEADPPAAPARRPARPAGPGFKRDAAAAGGQRTTAIVATLLLLAALGGVLVAFTQFVKPPPKPRLLTVHVEGYDRPGWAVAAADPRLLVRAFDDPDADRTAAADRNSLQLDKLRGRLAAVRDDLRAAADRPFVLSVSAGGVIRPQDGAPCLLPTDADLLNPATWLPVDDVLKALADAPGARRLLLLDVHRANADPFAGRPAEALGEAVRDLLQKRQDAGTLPCPVLVAAGPNEVSLPAVRDRCSAFTLYLADGLGGAAANADDEVRVSGLAGFVAHRVERYARRVHGRPQTPRLFTPAGDWDFVLVGRVTPQPPELPADPAKPEEYACPPAVRDAWKEWDALLAADADAGHPEGFARLTADLLRAERGWLATDDAASAGGACRQALNTFAKARAASPPAGPPADNRGDPVAAVAAVRLAARTPAPAPPELPPLLGRFVTAISAPGAKPDAGAAEQAGWSEKAAADPAAAARVVWQRLATDRQLSRGAVRGLGRLLDAAVPADADRPPPLEGLLVRFLADRRFDVQQGGLPFPAAAVLAWLRAEDRLGAALAAGSDGFSQRKPLFDAGERSRRAGAEMLFEANNPAQADAAARAFERAAAGFDKAGAAAGPGPKRQAALPPLLRAVLHGQPGAAAAGGERFAAWVRAADTLEALLAGGPATEEAGAAVRRLAEFVAPARADEWDKKKAPWDRPDEVRAALALVAGPGLPADARAKVLELVRREWWHLHDQARRRDADDVAGGAVLPTAGPPVIADPDPADDRRKESAGKLLRLAGGTDPAQWRDDLPKRAAKAVQQGDWGLAARVVRVVPPAVAGADLQPRPVPPAAALLVPVRDDRDAFRRWAAEQLEAGYQTPVDTGRLWDKIDPDRALRTRTAGGSD